MTKSELQEAIKNGESVWIATEYGIKELKKLKLKDGLLVYYNEDYKFNHAVEENYFDDLYKTKAEAEHYLHHANITRTEQLPFLTWDEFLKETMLKFIACDGISNMILYCCNNTIYLVDEEYPEFNTTSWDLTEENFYKAYDECVRLFKS